MEERVDNETADRYDRDGLHHRCRAADTGTRDSPTGPGRGPGAIPPRAHRRARAHRRSGDPPRGHRPPVRRAAPESSRADGFDATGADDGSPGCAPRLSGEGARPPAPRSDAPSHGSAARAIAGRPARRHCRSHTRPTGTGVGADRIRRTWSARRDAARRWRGAWAWFQWPTPPGPATTLARTRREVRSAAYFAVFAQCGAVVHFDRSNNAGSTGTSTFQSEYSSACRSAPPWNISIFVANQPPPAFT